MFATTMLYVQKAEYEWPAANNEPRFKPGHPVTKLEGDRDVFGDGQRDHSLDPGAYAGSSIIIGEACSYRPVVLSGDAVHFKKQLGQSWVPANNFSKEPDAGLHAKDIGYACKRKSAALDQSRQARNATVSRCRLSSTTEESRSRYASVQGPQNQDLI